MNPKRRKVLMSLIIILGPVLAIMTALTFGLVDVTTLGRWDIAISIGAMCTVLIYLFKTKR
ncbi:MAG: hypothetical protein KGD60_15005 [Candidatus Thorarchaeota archaeon]|nr:hypothetical protein [Candidatus Thorarchaeota archaeon]